MICKIQIYTYLKLPNKRYRFPNTSRIRKPLQQTKPQFRKKSNQSKHITGPPGTQTSDLKPGTSNFSPQANTDLPINKEVKKELQKQQKIFQQLEDQIAAVTQQKSELEASLVDPAIYSDKGKFIQAETAFQKSQAELTRLNREYEEVFEKIMKLQNQ